MDHRKESATSSPTYPELHIDQIYLYGGVPIPPPPPNLHGAQRLPCCLKCLMSKGYKHDRSRCKSRVGRESTFLHHHVVNGIRPKNIKAKTMSKITYTLHIALERYLGLLRLGESYQLCGTHRVYTSLWNRTRSFNTRSGSSEELTLT